MNQEFTYRCTRLDGTGKEGVLKPDENGWYTIVVGALDHASKNVDADGNEVYYTSMGAERFFDKGTLFNERIIGGYVKAEYGHPKFEPGMTKQQFLERNLQIDERMVCATIHEVKLVPNYRDPVTGVTCVGIIAKIEPSGPYGEVLRKDLERKGMNVCFSIRSLTTMKVINGRKCKVLHTVVTFDYVVEPGIHCAEKLSSPSLESRSVVLPEEKGLDIEVSLDVAKRILKDKGRLSNESSTTRMLSEVVKNLEGSKAKRRLSTFDL